MKYPNIREEELKNKIAEDYFWLYNTTQIIGSVNFCVAMHKSHSGLFDTESLLWAEAKKEASNIEHSLVQLVLTIGKARTFDKFLPPQFLGAFDSEKIALIPYSDIHDIFYQNDFNWNVAPSNYETKEFLQVYDRIVETLRATSTIFYYENDDRELQQFIKTNFVVGHFGVTKTRINKNNFITIYNKWLQAVKPTMAVHWDIAKKAGIIDGDFYLADLLSENNTSLKDNLYVLLKNNKYELDRTLNDMGMFSSQTTIFMDSQKAHTQFWNKYERPPLEIYWDYIINRRDLLVPQDIRERKGSFFTPQIWVELSQKYLADCLGEDWQEEYYIWDCAAGTGNLLTGLTNKYKIFASTLDRQDVDVMKDRITNGANLLENHVSQFDFLNDDFTKCPESLQKIINDPEKRKKLVIYINPPYAEAGNTQQHTRTGENKPKVATENKIYSKYNLQLGKASNELFTQFLIRIYFEIPNCTIANFSTLKILQAQNFRIFREHFQSKLEKLFLLPANSFDNVKGKFPIGFFVWNSKIKEKFEQIEADVFDEKRGIFGHKTIENYYGLDTIIKWISNYKNSSEPSIGMMNTGRNDFQNQNLIYIKNNILDTGHSIYITTSNLIQVAIYFTVRHCIKATWLNDRDQFLFLNDGWQVDMKFKTDCLAYTLFNNNIQSRLGINHWIPFTESEIDAKEEFESHFMTDFIQRKPTNIGSGRMAKQMDMFCEPEVEYNPMPLQFSTKATAVFDAGRAL